MMTPNKKEFLRLVNAYLEGTATEKQNVAVERYFDLFEDQPDVLETFDQHEIEISYNRIKTGIDDKVRHLQPKKAYELPWRSLSIAATIFCMGVLSLYFYNNKQEVKPRVAKTKSTADIAPGSNKAILILSNGSKISLNNAKIGPIAIQNGTLITKANDSGLVYKVISPNRGELIYNRIETPRGGQFQVTLPDGTKVWLNATSALRYPLAFSGNERRVELDGEAYFEVAKNKKKPFKVITTHESVEVLGTHFSINAYEDEFVTKTSLIEGSIRVRNISSSLQKTLIPGQQAVLDENDQFLFVKNIDVDEAVSWKNGYFIFNNEPLPSILRKIARWYNVEIHYYDESLANRISFSGTLSKYSNVSKVLNNLELTEVVHFRLSGRVIIVEPYQ